MKGDRGQTGRGKEVVRCTAVIGLHLLWLLALLCCIKHQDDASTPCPRLQTAKGFNFKIISGLQHIALIRHNFTYFFFLLFFSDLLKTKVACGGYFKQML